MLHPHYGTKREITNQCSPANVTMSVGLSSLHKRENFIYPKKKKKERKKNVYEVCDLSLSYKPQFPQI